MPLGAPVSGEGLRAVAQEIVSEDEFAALLARAKTASRPAVPARSAKAGTEGSLRAPRVSALPGGSGSAAAEGSLRAPSAYIGFEPSGTAHVGWMVCTQAVRELVDAGFDVTILLADWHAQINDKFGGDLDAIQACGRYMMDAFEALGVARDSVTYRWANEFAADPEYWALVVRVAKHTSLARMRRAMDIMGRTEDDADRDVSKFFYPAMQVADIFYMDLDLALGGMDQRHAHMLARDVAKKLGRKAPVALHTPLVPNLKGGAGRMDPAEAKMSKSKPDSGIFLHDDQAAVRDKIQKAHCPAGAKDDNPVLDLLRLIVWPRLAAGTPFSVTRPAKFGGAATFATYDAVAAAFVAGDLHPADLKSAVAAAINDILAPVQAYFASHPDSLAAVHALPQAR
jgi:tyrosyl-tRNA synthetase